MDMQLETGLTRHTERQIQRIRAVKLIPTVELERCVGAPFNMVAFADEAKPERDLVYILVPQTENGVYPLGRHYRLMVEDGKVIDQRSFTKGCISLPVKPDNEGNRPAALTISHLLDPVPTEVQVFSVLAMRVPLYVITAENEAVWAIELVKGQPRIRLVERED
ncbi:MAG: hypothetical protein AAFX04_01585 [Pseudomonadota bacterium]